MKQTGTGSSKVKKSTIQSSIKLFEPPLWGILAFFALITLIFFSGQIFGSSYFWEDFVEYVYPVQTYAAREFSHFAIPHWNPYIFFGMPFIADLQVGFFYPLNRVLSMFVDQYGHLSVKALELLIILHFFIALVNMYFLAKYWKISTWGSALAAVSYSFSMIMVLHVIHPMMVYHFAWFPLVLFLFAKATDTRNIKLGIASGLVLGMTMLSGHPQATLYIAFLLGLYFIWIIIREIRSKTFSNKSLPFVIAGVLPFVIAVALFLIQYLPSQELATMSKRAEMTYEKSAEGSLEFKQAFTAVVPKLFGYINGPGEKDPTVPFTLMGSDGNRTPYFYYWETGFYFGIAALILGIFGAIIGIKKNVPAFLVLISIFGFLYALGSNGFLHGIFYNLPFFNQFRNPARMMYYAVFGFSLLSGFGFDYLINNTDGKALLKFIASAGLILLFAIICTSGAFNSSELPPAAASEISGFGIGAIFFAAIIAIIGFLLIKGRMRADIAGIVIVLLAFTDLYMAGAGFNKSTQNPLEKFSLPANMLSAFKPNPPDSIFRINSRSYNPSYMALSRNQGMVDGIMMTEGYNPLVLQRAQPPFTNNNKLYDVMNVKYRIAFDPQTRRPGFVQSLSMFNRAWLVYNYKVMDSAETYAFIKSDSAELDKTAILEKLPSIAIPQKIDGSLAGTVKITEYTADRIEFEVNSPENSILCVSEVWYPAWKATVNGNPSEILRADYSLRAVAVPKGKSTVVMEYKSSPYRTGAWVSFITLILCIIGLVLLPKQSKN